MKPRKVKRLPRIAEAIEARFRSSAGAMKASKQYKRKQQRLRNKQAIQEGLS